MATRAVFGPPPGAPGADMQSPDSSDCPTSPLSPIGPHFDVSPSNSLVRRQILSPSSSTSPSSPDGPNSLLFQELSLVFVKTEPESPRLVTIDVDLGVVGAGPSSTASPLASPTDAAAVGPLAVGKRPRGRPRKHPKPDPEEKKKASPKARSKTGCRTCRRRKKKCDETKPVCTSCEKNNVQCEGYPIRRIWVGGKQKTIYKATNKWIVSGPTQLPNIIQGVESQLDWEFFEHFNKTLSKVLTVNRDKNNPFQELLLPMAQNHRGLMHSILSLAGFHLCVKDRPSGQSWGHDQLEEIELRASFHFGEALKLLREDDSFKRLYAGPDQPVDPPVAAQVVILCLKSICGGDHKGEFLHHLNGLYAMLHKRVWMEEVEQFLFEFLIYHDISNSIAGSMQMPDIKYPPFLLQGSYTTASNNGSTPFLGVCQGLFGITGKIRQLRERVRKRRDLDIKPHVDFQAITHAKTIDRDLKRQESPYVPGSDEWLAWQVHRSSFWLFLHRTVNAPVVSSSPYPASPDSAAGSPPPAAVANSNEEAQVAVREAVGYLSAIDPGSAVQSVLLTPIFMIGCSAFEPAARPGIVHAFDTAERYSELGNIRHARSIVYRMWELMDAGDPRSWDWEGVMAEMGLSLLIS